MTFLLLALALLAYPQPTARARLATASNVQTRRPRDDPVASPHERAADIELLAACISGGMSHAAAVSAVASVAVAADRQLWDTVAALLRLGCSAEKSWQPLLGHSVLAPVAELAVMSSRGGTSIASGLDRIAASVRHTAETSQRATAERAGVIIAIPLAVCFLPAFLILGLVPIIVDIASTIF
ncbi:Bacterial type II secretion system protein F domain protein [Corynebacterium ciconiae DSM 44920]|uniref:type II secretion system F family protein n=1 Tax=Corynebacterium ciconiae TaxID=227319 RepID=UPI00036A08CC|nr:type II secretion system F family protein [Corynebacterium ciconiae]WKD62186.1 Bacterial type II secretion system protein F domain protein [Corynebacterium ciconiae DSM 44920]